MSNPEGVPPPDDRDEDIARPVRLAFDRGTIVFEGGRRGASVADLPGVLWDDRVRAYRAPAFRYRELAGPLGRLGISDEARPVLRPPGRWRTIDLRPYQEAALAAWELGGRCGLIVLPTGAGKTRVALAAMARTRMRTLCLVPTRALLEQWLRAVGDVYEASVGCLGDGVRRERAVTIATFESAYRSAPKIGNRFDLIVADEAHHFGCGVRDETLEMALAPARLGLSATPPEAEAHARRLTTLIGPLVHELAVNDLCGLYLAPYRTIRVAVNLSADERCAYDADMALFGPVMAEFSRLHPLAQWPQFVSFAARTEPGRRAVAAWRRARRLTDFNRGKREAVAEILQRHPGSKMLIFTADNDAAYELSRAHLIMPITCDIGREERREVLDRFARGELRRLVSARVLNEGIDVPDAEMGIVVAGTHGRREHVQRLGRILRPSRGKRALLYELVTAGTSEARRASRRGTSLAARATSSLRPA